MPHNSEGPQNTFVVRFWWEWQETGADQTLRWRGRIEHLQSGEGATFREAQQMLAFIGRYVRPLSLPQIKGKDE